MQSDAPRWGHTGDVGARSPEQGVKSRRLAEKAFSGRQEPGKARPALPSPGRLPVSSQESLICDGCLRGMIGQRPSYFLQQAPL